MFATLIRIILLITLIATRAFYLKTQPVYDAMNPFMLAFTSYAFATNLREASSLCAQLPLIPLEQP